MRVVGLDVDILGRFWVDDSLGCGCRVCVELLLVVDYSRCC